MAENLTGYKVYNDITFEREQLMIPLDDLKQIL